MLRPSPNHGTQRMPNDDVDVYVDDKLKLIILIIIVVFSIETTHFQAYLDALHNKIYRYTLVNST